MKIAFPPIVNNCSEILILGTMPGERSLLLNQYYGHAGNHFWKIVFNLFNSPFSKDYSIRKRLLLDNNVALWDVLQSCESKGSADSSIKNEKPNDFNTFYKSFPKIKRVYFASKAAEQYYDKYVRRSPERQYYTLPSPSSANTWKTFDEKLQEWAIILNK